MRALMLTFFGAVALFGIGACERHSFQETRKLLDEHDAASHGEAHAAGGHGQTAPAEGAHKPAEH